MVENFNICYGHNSKSDLFVFYCMRCNNLLCWVDDDVDVSEHSQIMVSYEINYCSKCGNKLNWNNLIYRNIKTL